MTPKAQYPEYSMYAVQEKFSKQMFIMLNYHRLVGMVSVIFGVIAVGVWVGFAPWHTLYGVVISVPPALLFGASFVQAMKRHEDILLRQRSRRKLLHTIRVVEPALYWCGLMGARGVCIITFALASIPSFSPLTPLGAISMLGEMIALLFMMQGMVGVWCVVYFSQRIRLLQKPVLTTAILTRDFLAQSDLRKN